MPRLPDPDLEAKILAAAHKLWKKGGDKALTMRAVAREAGTNTPAVYRRFRNREDIIRALLQRMRLEVAKLIEDAATPEEGCECYLEYALTHPHEYERFYHYNYEIDHSPQARKAGVLVGRPARNAIQQKLADQFGGSLQDHEPLMMALWMVGHGAAMLLIDKSIPPEKAKEARLIFTHSIRTILQSANGARHRKPAY